jgi:hypothetical protein
VDLGDGVLDLLTPDGLFDRAILDVPLQADELALQERLGEGGEIARTRTGQENHWKESVCPLGVGVLSAAR